MSHRTIVCSCGVRLTTCRCASPNKQIIVSDKPCTHKKEDKNDEG